MFEEFGINAGYVEDLHNLWRQSPEAVTPTWRTFFEDQERKATGANAGYTNGNGVYANGNGNGAAALRADTVLTEAAVRARVFQLVNAYRVRGHLFARIDPLGTPPDAAPELDLSIFGLESADMDTVFPTAGVAGLPERAKLRDIVSHLSETYCSSIGVEFTHIEEPEMREWLQNRMEETRNRCSLDKAELTRVVKRLTDAETF